MAIWLCCVSPRQSFAIATRHPASWAQKPSDGPNLCPKDTRNAVNRCRRITVEGAGPCSAKTDRRETPSKPCSGLKAFRIHLWPRSNAGIQSEKTRTVLGSNGGLWMYRADAASPGGFDKRKLAPTRRIWRHADGSERLYNGTQGPFDTPLLRIPAYGILAVSDGGHLP